MHNILVLKKNIETRDSSKSDLNFDFSFSKLQVVKIKESDNDIYTIIINMNEKEQLIYRFVPWTSLIVD